MEGLGPAWDLSPPTFHSGQMTYATEQHSHPQLFQCLLGPIPSMLQMTAAMFP